MIAAKAINKRGVRCTRELRIAERIQEAEHCRTKRQVLPFGDIRIHEWAPELRRLIVVYRRNSNLAGEASYWAGRDRVPAVIFYARRVLHR